MRVVLAVQTLLPSDPGLGFLSAHGKRFLCWRMWAAGAGLTIQDMPGPHQSSSRPNWTGSWKRFLSRTATSAKIEIQAE